MHTPLLVGLIISFLIGIFVLRAAPLNLSPKIPYLSGVGHVVARSLCRFLYVLCVLFLLQPSHPLWLILNLFVFFLLLYAFDVILPEWISDKKRKWFAPPATLIQYCFLPVSYPLHFLRRKGETLKGGPFQVKQELIELIQEADTGEALEEGDKDLIESVVTFHNRIAREIMVPRVDIFALPAKTTIQEAMTLSLKEGYSRIPVYKGSIDEIFGILMFKDVLMKYMEYYENRDPTLLDVPIEGMVKKTLYAPETKKITHLLQEFQKKQMHMAIIVDEYGGTEGIVTIENILEEIVGEIADEYDDEADLFTKLPGGNWIVDAKMTILDVEEELDIEIPQEGEYDTIGGYIYHRAGTIPSPGFTIDHDEFSIEVLESNERGVDKVRITVKS